jgi:hypothetical protein
MATSQLVLTGGPDRNELLEAASEASLTMFDTPAGAIEVQITGVQEIGVEGTDFTVWGQLESSELRGAVFTGNYNCDARTGRLAFKTVSSPHP